MAELKSTVTEKIQEVFRKLWVKAVRSLVKKFTKVLAGR
jgi:hypothetical protein